MSEKSNIPKGTNSSEKELSVAKRMMPTLLLSSFFVAISFIVMLIPLAIFNIALISAMLGKRIAFFLMIFVSFVLIILGLLLGNFIAVCTGVLVILAIPFFMLAVTLREKKQSWFYAAAVLFAPVLIFFGLICFAIPQYSQSDYEKMTTQVQQILVNNKTSFEKSLNTKVVSSTDEHLLKQYDQYIEQFNQTIAESSLKEFLTFSHWQRVIFFVFGIGSSFFLIALLTSFANVVFVDLGFEQIERLTGIMNYLKSKSSSFPPQLIQSLFSLTNINRRRSTQTPIEITNHSTINAGNQAQENYSSKNAWISYFWKPLKSQNMIAWQGYLFSYQGSSPWNLKKFSLPFPIAIIAVAFIGALSMWKGDYEKIVMTLHGASAPVIATASILSFAIISIVALQGLFTLYKRVSIFFVFFIMMLSFFTFGSNIAFSAYTFIAIFGTIGLLDYVYDWRGRKKTT